MSKSIMHISTQRYKDGFEFDWPTFCGIVVRRGGTPQNDALFYDSNRGLEDYADDPRYTTCKRCMSTKLYGLWVLARTELE